MAKPKLWMHRLWQLPKGFKDYAISQGNRSQKFLIEAIFTYFFRQSSRSFWEKMSPKLRSTSRTSTLRPNVYTMSPCLNHESMAVPSVWLYTMSLFLYHEYFSNPCFHFYTMRNTVLIYTEIQITRIKKYKFQNYRNTTYRFTEIQITEIQNTK